MRANTSSASRMLGTTFGCAKLATSTTGTPSSLRRSHIHTLSSVGIHFGRLCNPSRGATSTTRIFSGRFSMGGSSRDSEAVKGGELLHRSALGHEAVLHRIGIGVPERHSADDDFLFGDVQ